MRNVAATLVAIALASAPSVQAQSKEAAREQPLHPDVLPLIDAWLDAEHAYRALPSLVVSVVKGDTVVFAKGYGSIDDARTTPATPQSLYSICSISKVFTSIAVMQLAEQGKLRLDDEVAAHLPEFKLSRADPAGAPVTIRSVLMHSSGLPREAIGDYWTGPDYRFPARPDMLAGLATQEMFERPLSRYQYSNLGIALLGEIVARRSGIPYERYVQENIIAPLGLAHTAPRIPDDLRGKALAAGHGARKRDGTREVLPPFDARGLQAAAGFSSSVEDLSKMVLWQFRLLKTDQAEVLKSWSLREMQRIQWTDPDGKTTWGLGFGVSRSGNDVFVGHSGWCPGYRTTMTMIPARELGAVVALSSMEDPSKIGRTVLALAQKKPTKAPEKAAENAPDLAQYVGTYSFQPWSAETRFIKWGNDLAMLTLPSENPATELVVLRHAGKDDFRAVRDDESLGATVSFLRDESGRVKRVRIWASTAALRP